MNSAQVNDVFEVPAYQYINSGHAGDGDVLRISTHLGCEHPRSKVGFCKVSCLGVELERLDVRLRHRSEMLEHLIRGGGQFLHRKSGHDEDEIASHKTLHEPDGILGELVVFTTSDH